MWVSSFSSSIRPVSLLTTYSKQRHDIVSGGKTTDLSDVLLHNCYVHSASRVHLIRNLRRSRRSFLAHACVPRLYAFTRTSPTRNAVDFVDPNDLGRRLLVPSVSEPCPHASPITVARLITHRIRTGKNWNNNDADLQEPANAYRYILPGNPPSACR